MIFLASYTYTQSSPSGGQSYNISKNVVMVVENEIDVKTEIEEFLSDDDCGYRRNIKLVDLKRI